MAGSLQLIELILYSLGFFNSSLSFSSCTLFPSLIIQHFSRTNLFRVKMAATRSWLDYAKIDPELEKVYLRKSFSSKDPSRTCLLMTAVL